MSSKKLNRNILAGCSGLAYAMTTCTTLAQCATELAKVIPADVAPFDRFGNAVAVEGDVVVVGAIWDENPPVSNAGGAYVFRWTGTLWVQEAKLTAPYASSNDYFGASVAISGNSILIGGEGGFNEFGSAYVFTYNGSSWHFEAELTASYGSSLDGFGGSVSINGNHALVGAYQDDHAPPWGLEGSAYVFRRDGTSWTQEQKLTAFDAAGTSYFGHSVSLGGDLALIGADGFCSGCASRGAAYVFRREGTSWVQEAKLLASDGMPQDAFGRSVSISGGVALIGAFGDGDGVAFNTRGSAYVFRRVVNSWLQEAKLVNWDAPDDLSFGWAVSLDGDMALIGAHAAALPPSWSGAAYVFRRVGSSWLPESKLLRSTSGPQFAHFGYAVALNASRAIVGADKENSYRGAAYVFEARGTDCNVNGMADAADLAIGADTDCQQNCLLDQCDIAQGTSFDFNANNLPDDCESDCNANGILDEADILSGNSTDCDADGIPDQCAEYANKFAANDPQSYASFGQSVAAFGDRVLIGAPHEYDININGYGSVYVFRRDGIVWIQEARLLPPSNLGELSFGWSVALHENIALVGNICYTDILCHEAVVHVFHRQGMTWHHETTISVPEPPGAVSLGASTAFDGTRAVFSAPFRSNGDPPTPGAAFVFRREGMNWVLEAQLQPPGVDPNNGSVPYPVAISGDCIAFGISTHNDFGLKKNGAVFLYRKSGSTWTPEAQINPLDASSYDYFGSSVALESDLLVVGATPFSLAGEPSAGSVYIFRKQGTKWIQEAKLAATDAASYDRFGRAVAMDAGTIIVGAPYDYHDQAGQIGAIYLFVQDETKTWVQKAKLTAPLEDPTGLFGDAIFAAGGRVIVGARGTNDPYDFSGSAYVLDLADCDGNGLGDACELSEGTVADCQPNGVIDGCEIALGLSRDCDGNSVPDECQQPDGDGDSTPDVCDCDVLGCGDGNPCTDDICNGATCEFANNTVSCNDGDGCTIDDICSGGVCTGTLLQCRLYGDVTAPYCVVDVDDVLYVLNGFVDPPVYPDADLEPCGGDGDVDVDDILAVLGAFTGTPECPDPCVAS